MVVICNDDQTEENIHPQITYGEGSK